MKLIWSHQSATDLNGVYDYYAEKSVRVAVEMYNSVIDEVEILKSQPYIAAIELVLKDNPKDYRSLIVAKGKLKVVYFVKNDTIAIVRIWHCRQNPEDLKNSLV